MCATCGWVNAGGDVKVTECVGMRNVVGARLVAVVPAVQVRLAAGHRGMGHAMERGDPT